MVTVMLEINGMFQNIGCFVTLKAWGREKNSRTVYGSGENR